MTSFKIPIGSNTFESLTLVENGLILNNGNKGEKEIPFSKLNKIYLKKYKIHPIFELLFVFFPFILVYIVIQYFPFELLIIAALFTFIPVFIAVHNCQWYRLKVHLKDGTTFIKIVPLYLKSENIIAVKTIRREYFNYKTNTLVSA